MPGKIRHYQPLPDCVTVKKSKLHGLGLFAAKPIPAGYDLGISHIVDDRFEEGYSRTPLGGFINYSSAPNCVFDETDDMWHLKTDRTVKKGEELTADYEDYDEAVLAAYN